jgi:hypothetical protein
MSNTTPPGWYDDGQGSRRWWDGSQWAAPGQGPSETPQQPTPTQQLPQQTPGYGTPAYGAPQGDQPAYGQQPGYGQQAGRYGQQPGFGAPNQPPKKKKTGLIIGIVAGLLLIAAAIVAAILLLRGSDDTASSDDPTETVQNYIDAGQDGDCEAAVAALTDDLQKQIDADCDKDFDPAKSLEDLGVNPDDLDYKVGKAEIDGDKATVPVTVSGLGDALGGQDEISSDYQLVKQDGTWLISGFAPTGVDTGDLPDGLPGDLPTDGLPSELPSDFPSELPSDFPTELPSDFPTDFPTSEEELDQYLQDLESQFPEGSLPSDSPS